MRCARMRPNSADLDGVRASKSETVRLLMNEAMATEAGVSANSMPCLP